MPPASRPGQPARWFWWTSSPPLEAAARPWPVSATARRRSPPPSPRTLSRFRSTPRNRPTLRWSSGSGRSGHRTCASWALTGSSTTPGRGTGLRPSSPPGCCSDGLVRLPASSASRMPRRRMRRSCAASPAATSRRRLRTGGRCAGTSGPMSPTTCSAAGGGRCTPGTRTASGAPPKPGPNPRCATNGVCSRWPPSASQSPVGP
jgi:hypothetical protein